MNTKISDPFHNVLRTAMVLKPKQPFYDWLKRIEPNENFDADDRQCDVYLLPDFETEEEMEAWLQKNFDEFFCEQLNNWYVDDSYWVDNRTFKMFKEWFDYELYPMVWDTLATRIEKI